jgi:ubiquinone/menaquinone biosynthesis C-methylase UbiE/cephalosporin hydroxylase
MRSDYKGVWTALSETLSSAKMHVSGTEDEATIESSGVGTSQFLLQNVGIRQSDVLLEIGCGIGRVGKYLAPHCRRWIGADVSPNMLAFAAERLRGFSNVEFMELSGNNLSPVPDDSIDLVYCTVVFMHLESWDRYSYVEEAFRVLRPGGKLYVDNVNLCSDAGWAIFETYRKVPLAQRPDHITVCSVPQELTEYLERARFEQIESQTGPELISVWGRKPLDSAIVRPPDKRPRSRVFSGSTEPRLWWHRREGSDYVPPIYSCLSDEEWQLMQQWYVETSAQNLAGECAVPLMSLLQGLVMGNVVRAIVQLGTFAGYSALLLGFFLRQMGARHGLFSLEIDEFLCGYSRGWLERAGLVDFVQIEHRSSIDHASPGLAAAYLGRAPQLVLVDSSHEYEATVRELEAWYPVLAPGGLMVLHDTSRFAVDFDAGKKGGVAAALREWRAQHPDVEAFSLNADVSTMEPPPPVYQDACGMGLIQKPHSPAAG